MLLMHTLKVLKHFKIIKKCVLLYPLSALEYSLQYKIIHLRYLVVSEIVIKLYNDQIIHIVYTLFYLL